MSKKNIYHHKKVPQEYITNEGLVPANITDFTWDKIGVGVSLIFPKYEQKQINGKWDLEWNGQKELVVWNKKTENPNNIVTLEMVTLNNNKIRLAYDKNANGISPEYVYKDKDGNICVYPDYVGWDCMTDINHFAFQYFANGKCNGNIDDKSSFSRVCMTIYDNTISVSKHITNEDFPKIMQNAKIGGTIKYPIKFGTEFVDARVYDVYDLTQTFTNNVERYSDTIIFTEYGIMIDGRVCNSNFSTTKGGYYYEKCRGDEKGLFLQPDIDFINRKGNVYYDKSVFYISSDFKKLSMSPKDGYIELQNNKKCIKYLINCVLAINNIPIYEKKIKYDNMELAYQCLSYLNYSQKNTCVTEVFDGEFYQNYFTSLSCNFFFKNNINIHQSWNYQKEEDILILMSKIKHKFFQLYEKCLGWSYSPYQIRKEYDPLLDNGELGKMLDEQDKMVEEFFEEKIKPLIPYKW